MATHPTPNSRSVAVIGAGGGLGWGPHRWSSAPRGTRADRRHRHLSDRRVHPRSWLLAPLPVILRPRGSRRRGVCGAGPSMTWLPSDISAVTIRDSRPTRA